MAEDIVEIGNTGPKWKVDKTIDRPQRLKQIRIIKDENGTSEPFVEKVATAPFSVRYLEREFHFLSLLRYTGVTPIPQMFKKEEKSNEGRLMIEHVPGMSLEERLEKGEHLGLQTLPRVIELALNSVDTVHARGVLVWDLNKGSFMITDDGSLKIVDFELSRDENELSDPDVQRSLHVSLESSDIGIKLANFGYNHQFDAATVKASERHEAADTILKYYFRGPNSNTNQFRTFDFGRLNSQDRDIFETRKKILIPQIEQILLDEYPHDDETRRAQLRNWMLTDANMDITLPYLLEDKGVTLDPSLLTRVKKALSPFLSGRI